MNSDQKACPAIISDPDGETYVLADSEQEALEEATAAYGDDFEHLVSVGWMCQVSYPDDYQSREEWEESPNFCETWWQGCQAPTNAKQFANAMRAWVVCVR